MLGNLVLFVGAIGLGAFFSFLTTKQNREVLRTRLGDGPERLRLTERATLLGPWSASLEFEGEHRGRRVRLGVRRWTHKGRDHERAELKMDVVPLGQARLIALPPGGFLQYPLEAFRFWLSRVPTGAAIRVWGRPQDAADRLTAMATRPLEGLIQGGAQFVDVESHAVTVTTHRVPGATTLPSLLDQTAALSEAASRC